MSIEHAADTTADVHSAAARQVMIESQLRPSGVNAPWVLHAMLSLPREPFVPAEARAFAYIDRAVPLGGGRFLAPPLFHGRLLEEAAPTATDRVLIVSSTDYLATLVRPVAASVAVAEAGAPLPGGDYTLILIDGAAEAIPDALIAALAEGGRIVGGIFERGTTRLAAGRKVRGDVAMLPLADMDIPRLPEYAAPRRWSF